MKNGTVIFDRNKRGEWAWKYLHANGNEIARSPDGYTRRTVALRVWKNFVSAIRLGSYNTVIKETRKTRLPGAL